MIGRRDKLGAVRPAMYFIAAGICPSLMAQQQSVPTFGTTVIVPGGLVGVVYNIPPESASLPYFGALHPAGVIYTSSLNVPTRDFREGFPGVTDRLEWFAIDYNGRFWIDKPGFYQFVLTSDDGAKLYIDGDLTVDNDGVHPPKVKAGRVKLNAGIHHIQVSYFQGPRSQVALVLQVAGPGEEWRIFSTDEFKPPPDPETWATTKDGRGFVSGIARSELRVSPDAASPGDEVVVEVMLQSIEKEVVALRWVVVVPAQIVEMVGAPETGPAGGNSGKSVACSIQKSYLYVCTLAGDRTPITSGAVAIFHFKVRSDTQARTSAFRIEEVEAETVDRRKFTLSDAERAVTIH
jgi:hypothetical protein